MIIGNRLKELRESESHSQGEQVRKKQGKHLIAEGSFQMFCICCPSPLKKFSAFRS